MANETTTTNRPQPPEDLAEEALLEWDRLCNELQAVGKLDKADRAIIAAAAETYGIWRKAMSHVRLYGPILPAANGVVGRSPFYSVAKEMAAQLRGLLGDLGLTPAARGKGNSSDPGGLDF